MHSVDWALSVRFYARYIVDQTLMFRFAIISVIAIATKVLLHLTVTKQAEEGALTVVYTMKTP